MQCDNAVVHCKAFIENPSLSQIPTSQSEYVTNWELCYVLCQEKCNDLRISSQ
jgi:hypothetical protein